MPRRKKRGRSELATSEPDDDSIMRNSQQRKMATPREHIEEIRRRKFSIGGEERNPLTEDLHQAVKNLSAELYAKDVHFLMELIQNAEDNEYMEGVDPTLEFIITSKDITATGAQATLLIFNNEKGFSPKNIDSICSVGRSTKKGNRNEGFIGEKGIGFKSVFLITSQPYIFSNGYQIRFNEDPCSYCNVGYIVPEWVDENPTLSDIKSIYGSGKILPTTVIILPLKPDKINAVKQQLLNLHPEVLLFLSKIKSFSVQEVNEDPSLNTVNRIAISSEKNFAMRKNIDAESYMLHLSAEENSNQSMRECGYYMWKQKFQVRPEGRVEKRMEVDEFWITLAFPIQDRLHRGTRSPGVYAFLPTEMITNFPFIIQADFVLVSSRETILLDDKWNQGILDCVPSAFVSAFTSLLKSSETAPLSSLTPLFTYIPVRTSSYPKFDLIREAIRTNLIEEDIIPSESCTDQKFFHKPKEVRRLMPSFWSILKDARAQGVSLHNLSSRGRFILSSSFGRSEYDDVLNFLGVKEVSNEWYPKFLENSDLILDVEEKIYVKLLAFVSGKWDSKFQYTSMRTLPLVKYIDQHGRVSLCSASDSSSNEMRICLSTKLDRSSWLIEWNKEFRCKNYQYFVPTDTEVAIGSCADKEGVLEWLKTHLKVVSVDVYDYAVDLLHSLDSDSDSNQVVSCAHFLYHSLAKKYISQESLIELCTKLPLLNNSRRVITTRSGVLVPGKGSKWVELMGSNPWSKEGYIELGEAYLRQGRFAGEHTPVNQLMEFLKTYVGAIDIPHLHPPNSGIPAVSGPLTRANALSLLEWIRNLKYNRSNFPDEFLKSIKMGSWLRVTLSGASPGYRPPSQSFFPNLEWGKLFQNAAVNIDVPLIDQDFYGGISIIKDYKEELKMLGVMCEYGEACEYIGNHLMSLSSSSTTLTRSNAFSILVFVRFLRDKYLPVKNFVSSIKQRSWLKTTLGVRSPVESVLFDEGWRTAAQITNIPFLDHNFYGEDLLGFREELKILGVVVGLDSMHNTVAEYLKPPNDLNVLKQDTLLLVLMCIRLCESPDKIVTSLKYTRCLKTNSGYRSPAECFWPDPEWSCLLQVLDSIPVVDVSFYSDNILTYKEEMTRLGVVADLDKAVNAFCGTFRQQATSLPTQKITSFLACYRKLSKTSSSILSEVNSCITEVKWLRTKSGDYKSPGNCILYGKDWKCISQICSLPLLDDEEIQGYKKELKCIGVVVNLEDGIDFVISGLRLLKVISPDNVLALLKCIRIYLKKKDEETLPESFLSKVVSQDWLKTHAGYLPPNRCSLFDPQWAPHLKPTDGPFIDEVFYKGGMIKNYRKELQSIGVIVDVKEVCHLMAGHIYSHSDTSIIMRIYDFLRHFEWDKEADDHHQMRKVWIPMNATWASPKECVRHDKNDLFSSRLNVLDKDYETKYLEFFFRAFRVKKNPSMNEYFNLWKEWEVSKDSLSVSNCCAFWGYVVKHWSSKVEKMLTEGLKKLPVVEDSGKIVMSDKCDAFIPDDLLLKDVFAHRLLFVWYPKTSDHGSPNRVQLLDIYRKIGVLPISQYLNQQGTFAVSVPYQTKKSNSSNIKGLVRLILSFLANPPINMEVEKRHEAVKCLADVSVFESVDPVTVSYKLPLLSSGEVVSVTAKRMVRWERESSKIFVQKRKSCSQKDRIEYGVHLGEEISKGVIWDEKEENINALAELIKLGYLLEFDEEAMDYLIKSKNLQVFDEDVEFLSSSAFLAVKLDEHRSRNEKVCVVFKKRR